jgi:DNA-binding GntR family transcriptional regulator
MQFRREQPESASVTIVRNLRGAQSVAGGGARRRASDAPIRSSSNVSDLYSWVRTAILNGKMKAGEKISQARLSSELGVSRTPLREALRMLQAEGLVVGELNQRMQVASVTAEQLDSLYAARILLESFGLSITVPLLKKEEIRRIRQTLKYMGAHDWTGDRAAWELQHNAFHGLLVMHVKTVLGTTMSDTIADFQLRAERYRRLYVRTDPNGSAVAAQDHARIVKAIAKREVDQAVFHLSHHLARTAFVVLATYAPDFEATATRNALRLVSAGDADAASAYSFAMAFDSGRLPALSNAPIHPIDPYGPEDHAAEIS